MTGNKISKYSMILKLYSRRLLNNECVRNLFNNGQPRFTEELNLHKTAIILIIIVTTFNISLMRRC